VATKKSPPADDKPEPDPLPADADEALDAFNRGEMTWRDYVAAVRGK
jgi:hypothetical protein